MQLARYVSALLVAACTPAVAFAGYGLDVVPGASFHQGTWQFYGTDQIPSTGIHTAGLLTAYGSDRIPGSTRDLPEQHPHHSLIAETIQHLTGGLEMTPGRVQKSEPARQPGRQPQPNSNCPGRR